jgi:outer membrane biosynthesis protein TonB
MTTALVVLALALVCLLAFFVIETRPKKTLSMLDLAEFKDLPGELRAIVKSMMPNPTVLKKQWAHMAPQQKQMVIQQLTNQVPHGPQQDNRPPAPSYPVKHEAEPEEPVPAEPVEISEVEPEPVPEPEPETGLKPGFLLTNSVDKSQKKNAKNKKKDKIVTFSDIGSTEDEEPIPADSADL